MNWASVVEVNEALFLYLKSLKSLFCGACGAKKWKRSPHNPGFVYDYIRSERELSEAAITRFVADAEHGIFHGIMTGFLASQLDSQFQARMGGKANPFKNRALVRNLLTCMLHDWAKVIEGRNEPHDEKLRQWFPRLNDDVFSHSAPHEATTLVQADRLELMRYPDWESWVDVSRVEEGISVESLEFAKTFHHSVRPGLLRYFESHERAWIQHGPEQFREGMFDSEVWPPRSLQSTYMKSYIQAGVWPAYASRHILRACGLHSIRNVWQNIFAIAPFSEVGEELEFVSMRTEGKDFQREHPLFAGHPKIGQWTFLYRSKIADHPIFSNEVESLLDRNVSVIQLGTLNLLLDVVNLFAAQLEIATVFSDRFNLRSGVDHSDPKA